MPIALLLLVLGFSALSAQNVPASRAAQSGRAQPIATLSSWADDVWLALLDRDGAYFGRLAEQGTFQRFNRLMDHEYELDVATGLFTETETAEWASVRTGIRAAGASISHPLLLNVVEWRQDIPVAGQVVFVPRFVRQHTLTSRRDYFAVAVEGRDLGPLRALRGGFGVHAFKASGDLELGVELGSPRGSTGPSAGFRVALVDAFTNPVFRLAGRDPEQADTHYHYQSQPLAARVDLAWVLPYFRVELSAGASTTSAVLVTFPNLDAFPFRLAESFRFAGALVEVAPWSRAALAGFGTTARATTRRRPEQAGGDRLDLLEETSTAGGRARLSLNRSVVLELDGRVKWRPERRVEPDSTIRHHDREVFSQAMVLRRPPSPGWLGRFGFASVSRQAGVLASQLDDTDSRLLTELGWWFQSGFELSFGVRWDLDASGTFDGGHLRVVTTW